MVREDHPISECVAFHGRTTISVTAAFQVRSTPVEQSTQGHSTSQFEFQTLQATAENSSVYRLWHIVTFFIFASAILLLTYLLTDFQAVIT